MINPAKLKELRNTKKQSDVANEIGISQNHYSQIENGLKNPSLGIATRIAEFFDVSVDEILTNPPPKISSDVKDVEVIDNQRSVKEENVGVVQVNIRTRIKLRGVVEVETTYGIQEPGINANVITQDGRVMGIEIKGFVGGNVSRDDIGKLARDFEHSVGNIIERLVCDKEKGTSGAEKTV